MHHHIFDRIRIALRLCRLPRDVVHKLRLYEQVWGVDAATVVTTLVQQQKIRLWRGGNRQQAAVTPMGNGTDRETTE